MTVTAEATVPELFPRLKRPPLSEVACGFVFPSIEGLDAFEFGVYWDQRRDEYPGRQVQPAIMEDLSFTLGTAPPTRAYLIGPDGEWLQQIQADRFYVNWRKTEAGTGYPHFSDSNLGSVPVPGIKSRALAEFKRFTRFCEEREMISSIPEPSRIEIVKIDTFTRGTEWNDLGDLIALLPIVGTFAELSDVESITIALQVQEMFNGGKLTVRINSMNEPAGVMNSLRLETRVGLELTNRVLEEAFTYGNERLNRMFFHLLPDAVGRFGKEEIPCY